MYFTQTGQRRWFTAILLLVLGLSTIAAAPARPFPGVIPLPGGFQPEGIASGTGTIFYVGSIPTGDVYRGDFRTGEGALLVEAPAGRSAIGMKYDARSGLLFVAGGGTGYGYVYDGETGETVAVIPLSTDPSFINDVVITRDAVYFTNSRQPYLYQLELEKNGQLPEDVTVREIPLGGEYLFNPAPDAFNANGIAATPNGKTLIIVNSSEGALYNVDPITGHATRIDLGGASVPNGVEGKTLHVVQNRLNQIAVIALNPDLTEGTIVDTITNAAFRVPTTIARFGNSLYAVNARFGTPPTPTTEYEVVRVPRK